MLSLLLFDLQSRTAIAAEPLPGDACSTQYIFSQTGGPETTGVRNMLMCNGSTWQQRMTFTSAGYVGIGTVSPTQALEVNGTVYANTITGGRGGGSTASLYQLFGWGRLGVGTSISLGDNNPTLANYISTSNGLTVGSTGLAKSSLDVSGGLAVGSYATVSTAPSNGLIVSGGVGIGTSAPAALLHVNGEGIFSTGSLACSAATAGGLRYNSGATAYQFCNGTAWTTFSSGSSGVVQLPTQATMTTCNGTYIGALRLVTPSGSAPSVASFSSAAGQGGSVSVAQPSGLSSGDLLVMVLASDNNVSTISLPVGFNMSGIAYDNASGADTQTLAIATKIATVSEPLNYSVNVSTTGSGSLSVGMLRIPGGGTIKVLAAASPASTVTTKPVTVTSPTITPTSNNNLILWVATGDTDTSANNYTYTVPSGMTAQVGPVNDGNWTSLQVASKAQTTAAATGALSGTVTYSVGATNTGYVAFTVAVPPAAAYAEFCDGSSWSYLGGGS